MEEKGKVINGPMLLAKRTRFEEKFDVPPDEQLTGDHWLSLFCKMYKIKEC
jgi:hypothetical protein